MPSIEVRPFRRSDRDQVTSLVKAHAEAVVPGASVAVNTVLSQLEREPGEFIVDPWVRQRATLVAEQRGRVAAAAHLLRYGADDSVGDAYRDVGEIRWFLFWPEAPAGNPHWPSAAEAAAALLTACIAQLDAWGVTRQYADGALPVFGVYGVPEQWPHIRASFTRAGFTHKGDTEIVYLAKVADLPGPGDLPMAGMSVRRSVGMSGTRLSAMLGDDVAGYIEVEVLAEGQRLARQGGWADVGNLHVGVQHRRRGVATWLLGQAADWLRLAQVERLLNYASLDEEARGYRAFLAAVGFRELTRTKRGWSRDASG